MYLKLNTKRWCLHVYKKHLKIAQVKQSIDLCLWHLGNNTVVFEVVKLYVII
jgi:hypothetical protein